MAEDLAAIQSQLDDIKGAIFVLVDRMAAQSNRLDASISELNRLALQQSARPPQAPESHYPQVQERLATIAALEKELLDQVRANSDAVRLIGVEQKRGQERDADLTAALQLVARQLAELTTQIESHKADGGSAGVIDADVDSPHVAKALTLMAQKLDEHLQEQKREHEAITGMVADIVEASASKPAAPAALEMATASSTQAVPAAVEEFYVPLRKGVAQLPADDLPPELPASPEASVGTSSAEQVAPDSEAGMNAGVEEIPQAPELPEDAHPAVEPLQKPIFEVQENPPVPESLVPPAESGPETLLPDHLESEIPPLEHELPVSTADDSLTAVPVVSPQVALLPEPPHKTAEPEPAPAARERRFYKNKLPWER